MAGGHQAVRRTGAHASTAAPSSGGDMSVFWIVLNVMLWLALVPILAASAYLGLLALLARRRLGLAGSTTTRFDIVVPAHNEEAGIEQTVRSLRGLEYPPELFRIL